MDTLKRLIGMCVTVLVFTAATASAQVRPSEAEQIRSRQQIATFETVLQQAVFTGAQNVIAQVKNIINAPPRLGTPRANGFRLEGVGMVFFVSVPAFEVPFMWEVLVKEAQYRNAAMSIQRMKAETDRMPPGPARAQQEQLIARLETDLALGNLRPVQPSREGGISAASLAPAGLAGASVSSVQPNVVDDPEIAYTREVKAAIIDVMLKHSQALGIGPEERLVVFARDGVPNNPQFPADAIDSSTWVMSVKGSVLAAFRAQTISEEEAQKQVEVKEQ